MISNPFSLEGKTILVTGASSNIGKRIAIRCCEMGANVFFVGRNQDRLQEAVNATTTGKAIQCDLADADSIKTVVSELPSLDGVVLSAARFDTTPVKFIKRESMMDIFNTNTFGNFDFVQKLVRQKKITKGGSVVFISSVASTRPYKGNSLYSATKGAINSFSKVLALELGSQKIRVNCIHPGIVARDTGIREGTLSAEQQRQEMEKFPLGMGNVDDIAYATVYLLSDVARWVTGTDMIVDGGQSLI